MTIRRLPLAAQPTRSTRTAASTDAITLLKADHKEIRRLFADFEKAGDGAEKTKQRLVDKMIELLTVHTYIENEVMYPRVRALLPDLEDERADRDDGGQRGRAAGRLTPSAAFVRR